MPNVPKLVGLTLPAALNALTSAGLTLGKTAVGPSATVQSGNVADVNPSENTAVAANAPVDLVISSGSKDWKELLAENYQAIAFNVLAALLFIFLAFQFKGDSGFLAELADKDKARGLITFLITATAAGLFIIMAISTLVLSSSPEEDKRFDRGKQILTMLVGILGTIVGFYFGTTAAGSQPALKVTEMKVEPAQVSKGEKFTISATVSGGKAPYTYSINFTPPLNLTSPVINRTSGDGKINEPIPVPADLAKDQESEYAIVVKDADGKSETLRGDGKISLRVAPPASKEVKETPKELPKQAPKQ